MNWKDINKKYSKAFDLFFKWFKGDPKATMKKQEFLDVNDIVVMHGSLRELYDFFDELEIFVHCYNIEISKWYWEIDEYGAECLKDYKTRKEAEKMAFEKAFELLEKKLN